MDMVEALEFCPAHVNLLLVGAGPYREALEARAQALGKSAQIRILPNRPLSELPQVMNALDALVLVSRTTPSWKEQFGRVIIEANACQIPVIGSDSGAISEVIGQAGLVVPERNPRALSQAICTLDADPDRRREMGLLGRQQVEASYTWERVAERMQAIYCRVMGERN